MIERKELVVMLTAEYADRNRAGSIDYLAGYNEVTRFLAICKQISRIAMVIIYYILLIWRMRASI